ncbi:PREDICTED: alpha-amylase-like [Ceratosolen solmsi marchali]|uniref:Alpha-amylase n=1 Tax=Ceratosolen solmsi marchali TaxID=326594 RepID=A0AAJ7DYC3_9HYME|nr:PREDICTED: alpha-amylase-like [Ceratosolen solmsi marchali]
MIPTTRIIALLELGLAVTVQLGFAWAYNAADYKDPHYTEGRTTMVHLFEWKFKDIGLECERFLGPMGYAGVQVSPISENGIVTGRPWFERYQPISYRIISRSGTEDDFKVMVSRCNAVGVRIYVDLVSNHMTTDLEPALGVGGSTAEPRILIYSAVAYGPDDFHPMCTITNYGDVDQVRNCSLNGLHDLDHSKDHVRDKIVEFVNRVIDHGIAGIRIDAAKHMWPNDLKVIYGRLKNLREDIFGPDTRPFIYQEVIDLDRGEGSNKWQYNNLGIVMEFIYGSIIETCFHGWLPLSSLENVELLSRDLMLPVDALVMLDNHDSQRSDSSTLTYKNGKIYKMALAFLLAHPYGHTCVMSSYAFTNFFQGPPADSMYNIISPNPVGEDLDEEIEKCDYGWVCEHRWPEVYGMVAFRNSVHRAPLTNWWSNGENQIAFSRGNLGFVAFNGQSDLDLKEDLQTALPAAEYCDVISGRKVAGKCTGKTVRVKDDGTAYIEILKDEKDGVLAIHAQTKL